MVADNAAGDSQGADQRKLEISWWVLRAVFVAIPVVAGLDKLLDFMSVSWSMYMSSQFAALLPMRVGVFLKVAAVVEICAGLLVLVRPRLGGYLVCAWLAAITVNLIFARFYDIALRDLGLSAAAFALARMSEVFAPAAARTHIRAVRIKWLWPGISR